MLKSALIFVCFLLCLQHLPAQTTLIEFNYEHTTFNDTHILPAEKYFDLTGSITEQVVLVEFRLYENKTRLRRPPIYENNWYRGFQTTAQKFYLPIRYKLRGNEEYDLVINYYRPTTEPEVQNLRTDLFKSIEAYLTQNLLVSGGKISLRSSASQMTDDLNALVKGALAYYRSPANTAFQGFSDLVKDKIRQVERHQLGIAQRLFLKKSRKEAVLLQRQQYIEELKALAQKEVSYLFNAGLAVLGDSKVIDNVSTEKTRHVFTLHAGYAGIGYNLDADDFSYASGFKAGITLPLGNRVLSSPFWRNTSIVAGVFLQNFEVDSDKISGPVLKIPSYVGLSYRLFQFVSLTAGVSLLETKPVNLPDTKTEIALRPFMGLVANIDIWVGLRK
jgi:hypothetical protein